MLNNTFAQEQKRLESYNERFQYLFGSIEYTNITLLCLETRGKGYLFALIYYIQDI